MAARGLTAARTPGRRLPAWLLAHFALSAAVFFLAGGHRNLPYKIESDGKYYYQFLLSAWMDGDLDFRNNYAVEKKACTRIEIDHYGFAGQLTATGRPTNVFTPGPALLWSPFFAATVAADRVARLAERSERPPLDGWERPVQYAVMFSAVVYSALALLLLRGLLRRAFSEEAVAAGLLVAFWGTNWLYYAVFEPAMSHVYDLFTLVLFLALGLRALEAGGVARGAAAGLAAGLHVVVRPQNLVTVAIACATAAVASARARSGVRLGGGRLVAFAAAFAAALAPLALSNLALFGSILAVPQGAEFLDLVRPHLLEVLFSARNGLFSHDPVLLLAAGGWIALAATAEPRRRAILGLLALLGMAFAAQLWINASVVDWWGGHAFGQRRLLSSLPVFGIGLCALADLGLGHGRGGRIAVWTVAGAAVLVNLELTAIHVFLWDYDEPHDILHWLFVRGPRAIWSRLLRL